LLNASGGTLGQPISADDTTELTALAERLDAEAAKFTNEEGRAGQVQSRLETEQVRLSERSNLLKKEIGDQADADVGEVSIKLSALMVQYEATAKTFSELSKLTLLDYL
jgi:flagellar hook-associated protein 3 FlgL